MPAPISKFASDRLVYDFICDPLAKHICFIHPNGISVMGFLITFPIIYNLCTYDRFVTLIVLAFTKAVLDCLDGAVARACKSTSKIGKYLDIICDSTSNILIGIAIWIMLKSTPVWWLGTGLIAANVYNLFNSFYAFEQQVFDTFFLFVHDNTVILNIVWLVFLKCIVKWYAR